MKNLIKVLGIIAIVAVIGFTFAACGDGNGGGGGGGPETLTYKAKGASSGDTYTLTVKKTAARAFTPVKGDEFELTDGTDKSKGSVDSFNGSNYTLQPSNEGAPTFGATVSGNDLTGLSGTITLTDGSKVAVTETLNPVTPPNPGTGGTFTLTGIPPEYNGKYANFTPDRRIHDDVYIQGGLMLDGFPQISGGRVSLPMWIVYEGTRPVRYSGNDTISIEFHIWNHPKNPIDTLIGSLTFATPVTFSNGNAARDWSDGTWSGDGTKPGTNPGGGDPGTFTLTGIPPEHNGKYVHTQFRSADYSSLIISQSLGGKFPQISGGSVSIPLWTSLADKERYYGNDTVVFDISLYRYDTFIGSDLGALLFTSVTFSNGGATRAWNEGRWIPPVN